MLIRSERVDVLLESFRRKHQATANGYFEMLFHLVGKLLQYGVRVQLRKHCITGFALDTERFGICCARFDAFGWIGGMGFVRIRSECCQRSQQKQ